MRVRERVGVRVRVRPGFRSCCDRSWGEVAFAGIGGGDDNANGFLVEALEATMALQVFEVAADGTFFDE